MKPIFAAALVLTAPNAFSQENGTTTPPPSLEGDTEVILIDESANDVLDGDELVLDSLDVPQEAPVAVTGPAEEDILRFDDDDEAMIEMPAEPQTLGEAILSGRPWLDLRYRFEGAELRGTPNRGWASTMRGALGYETAPYEGFQAMVELESVIHLFSDPFFDGANANRGRALIADPDGTELNQGYFSYHGVEGLDVRLGRQEISLGNERFVGADPWRQNHQSFDALRVRYELNENVDFDYSYAFRVNRVFGRQNPQGAEQMSTHFFDVRGDLEDYGRVAGYALLMDFDDSTTLNSNTFGLRYGITVPIAESEESTSWFAGRDAEVDFNIEYARQTDAFGNPINIGADYWLVEGSAAASGFRFRVAVETLGGSGALGDKFSTPFASYQGFNGFADQFGPGRASSGFNFANATPDAGLVDRSIGLAYTDDLNFLPMPASASVTCHWFGSDSLGLDYGTEIDLDLLVPLSDRAAVGARYADFNPDQGTGHSNRFSVWASVRLF